MYTGRALAQHVGRPSTDDERPRSQVERSTLPDAFANEEASGSVKDATMRTCLHELDAIATGLSMDGRTAGADPSGASSAAATGMPPPVLPTAPGSLGKAFEQETPPDETVLDGDVRILKVKQPWAHMLVKGIKDVENRGWRLTSAAKSAAWVIVASSQSKPSPSAMRDLTKRLKRAGNTLALRYDTDPAEYVYGHMLGMIRIEGCYSDDERTCSSVWYNPPNIAWVVSDAWEFSESVELAERDQGPHGFQTQVALRQRSEYYDRLVEQVRQLDERSL